jgi:hypothetical protein
MRSKASVEAVTPHFLYPKEQLLYLLWIEPGSVTYKLFEKSDIFNGNTGQITVFPVGYIEAAGSLRMT